MSLAWLNTSPVEAQLFIEYPYWLFKVILGSGQIFMVITSGTRWALVQRLESDLKQAELTNRDGPKSTIL